MNSRTFSGQVMSGLGQGASFTALPWAREQFIARLGIDPYPGTLNLRLRDTAQLAVWDDLRAETGTAIVASGAGVCDARCFPVRVAGCVPGAIVLPEVPAYDRRQVEIIAAVSLRERLALRDGDTITVAAGGLQRIRAAVFDVDGTLVNSIEGMRIAAQRAAAVYGYEVTLDMVRRALNCGESLWDMIIPAQDRGQPELYAVLRRETWRHWPDVLERSVSAFPGLADTLIALREAGLRLAIYTGSRGESFRPLERAGLMGFFDPVVTASDVSRPKPHPEGLLRCLEHLGLAPGETVYIGDTVHDMQAGRAAGMVAVGVLTGAADSAMLSVAGADRLLADHAALPGLLLS